MGTSKDSVSAGASIKCVGKLEKKGRRENGKVFVELHPGCQSSMLACRVPEDLGANMIYTSPNYRFYICNVRIGRCESGYWRDLKGRGVSLASKRRNPLLRKEPA